jgi:hypothetical protein
MAKYLDISLGMLVEQDKEVKEFSEKPVQVVPEGSSRYKKDNDELIEELEVSEDAYEQNAAYEASIKKQ